MPRRRPAPPRKGYCAGLQCTCDSDGEDRPRTPLGGYDSPPPKKKRKHGQGYKHDRSPHHNLIASLKRTLPLKQRKAILANAPNSFLQYLRNLTRRLVSGRVRVNSAQRKRLLPYGKLRSLNQVRQRLIAGNQSQKGGILPIIPFLIGLGPLLAKGLAVGAATAAGSLAVKKAFSNEPIPQTGSGTHRRNNYYYY